METNSETNAIVLGLQCLHALLGCTSRMHILNTFLGCTLQISIRCDNLPADPVVRSQMTSQFMRVVVATKRVGADNVRVRHE